MAKIMVVDDDPDFVEIMRTILLTNNYEVTTAANGKQALAMMRGDKPDLVLLDVMMTYVLDGLDVSQEMAGDQELKHIPIIMVSSLTNSQHAEIFPTDIYIPIDHWISKPVQPAELLEKVSALLNQHGG
ncbi:MAG: response regulator [Chloroflexota bacterium]|nr:response regulator [Chloroflexota bacterium]